MNPTFIHIALPSSLSPSDPLSAHPHSHCPLCAQSFTLLLDNLVVSSISTFWQRLYGCTEPGNDTRTWMRECCRKVEAVATAETNFTKPCISIISRPSTCQPMKLRKSCIWDLAHFSPSGPSELQIRTSLMLLMGRNHQQSPPLAVI